jgi:hypothetical protein
MLGRSPLPDSPSSLYPIHINTNPTPTQYQHPLTARPLPYDPPATYHHKRGSSMDPGAVDFRAFYPYTPNEVKHRKRTTPAQLKTLENIFRRDTKPNGPLRVELAANLNMSPRGVQVRFTLFFFFLSFTADLARDVSRFGFKTGTSFTFSVSLFQFTNNSNFRRAKEKNRAGKAAKAADVPESDNLNQDTPTSPEDVECAPDSLEVLQGPLDVEESSPRSLTPASKSPPALHVITNSAPSPWQGPRSDTLPLDQPNCFDMNLHAARRGSLPANAFVHTEHPTNSPQVDYANPFARRLSVDASLQRLANNPYAHLARAKNGALFGTRGMAHIRHRPLLGRAPYLQRTVSHNGPINYRPDLRRASADPRSFRPHPRGSSPSSLSHYIGIRTSLPEHNLYAVTSRPLPSPIPGPLPSPNFSFGAASTPSMASSSGSSDRNSPDSLQSFPFRGEEFDEEDLASAPYDPVSRFGSIVSVATSDSSINSAYYPDVSNCLPEHNPNFDQSGRRDSWWVFHLMALCVSHHFRSTSGNFLTLMSDLDVNGMPEDHNSYVPHEISSVPGIAKANHNEPTMEFVAYSSHPSPTSTISPDHRGSPPDQNIPLSTLPISRSSELAFALQSPDDPVFDLFFARVPHQNGSFSTHTGPTRG